MTAAELASIALYPELRSCPASSAPRILEIFTGTVLLLHIGDLPRAPLADGQRLADG